MSIHTEFGCNIDELDEGMGSVIIPSGPKGDTGSPGSPGQTPYIQEGFWFINGISTGISAIGGKGDKGDQGIQGPTGDTPPANTIVDTITNETEFYTSQKQLRANIFPPGMIAMWSGSADIYFENDGTGKKVGDIDMRGWGLCETNSNPNIIRGNAGIGNYFIGGIPYPIPNLSNRFVVGHSIAPYMTEDLMHDSAYETVRNTGGGNIKKVINNNNLPIHTHPHTHTIDTIGIASTTSMFEGGGATKEVINSTTTSTISTETAPNTLPVGGQVGFDTRAPFYVLAFIIKIDEIG